MLLYFSGDSSAPQLQDIPPTYDMPPLLKLKFENWHQPILHGVTDPGPLVG